MFTVLFLSFLFLMFVYVIYGLLPEIKDWWWWWLLLLLLDVFFATAIDIFCSVGHICYLIWFDLLSFFLHIIGWRLFVSINFMLCYVMNHLWGETSVGRNAHTAKHLWGEMSFHGAKCPWGEMSVGQKVDKSSQFSRRERNRAQQEFFRTWNKTCILAHNTCVCHVRYNNCGNKH